MQVKLNSKLLVMINKFITKCYNNNYVFSFLLFIMFALLGSVLVRTPFFSIATKMPEHIDAYLVSYIWSWDIHALSSAPLNLFQSNIFYPFEATLAYSETMLGTALLAWPIIALSGSIITTYNIVVLISFGIAGLGMYLLVYYLTKNRLAALISALIFAFAPLRIVHAVGHLHLTGMWLPYFFLYLIKFFKLQSWKNISLLSLFVFLIFLTGFHYAIFLPIVVIIFLLVKLLASEFRFNKSNIIKIVVSLMILSLLTIPLIIPYLDLHKEFDFVRTPEQIDAYSPGIVDYFVSPLYYNVVYSKFDYAAVIVCPGIFVFFLLFISFYLLRKYKSAFKPFKVELIIFSIIGIVALLVSFGFYIRLFRHHHMSIPGPYQLLYYFVPGFDGIRSTGRYSIFLLISIVITIGIAFSHYFNSLKDNFKKTLIIFVIATFILFEFAFTGAPMYSYPEATSSDSTNLYAWMKSQPDEKVFIELPMGFIDNELKTNYDILYVFRSSTHFKKIVNGYSGYYPPGYLDLASKVNSFDPVEDTLELKKWDVDYVIIHFDRYENIDEHIKAILDNVNNYDKLKFVKNFGNNYVFEIIYD
jgi:hypothetical protein